MDEEQKNAQPRRKPGPRPGLHRRSAFFQIYFTEAEKAELQAFFDSQGITANSYFRSLLDKDRSNRSK